MTFEFRRPRRARLAAAPYAAPPEDLPPALAALDYDGYLAITFRAAESLHLGAHFSAQLFHPGFLQCSAWRCISSRASDGTPYSL